MNILKLLLLAVTIIFVILYFLGFIKYKDYIENVNSKEYSLKGLLPVGLILIDILKLKFLLPYDNRLKSKIVQIYGGSNSNFHFKIHYASKFVYAYIGLILSLLVVSTDKFGYIAYIIIVALPITLFIYSDQILNTIIKERETQIYLNFPEVITSVILMSNAGLGLRQALYLTVNESKNDSIIYDEIREVFNDINKGDTELTAFSRLTERCRVKEVMMFVNIMKQDIRVGGSNNIEELKRLGEKCWDMRVNAAKRKGEEASAKLLIPIGIMFIAVLIAIVAPAFFKIGEVIGNF